MRVLRSNRSSIVAQLEIFVHEPIFVNTDNEVCGEGHSKVLDRVIEKLSGKDPHVYGEESVERNVENQVHLLLQIASDPYRYVNHYFGWCQFW
jgi:phosphatidylinositol kinase/protein kinase (PI-3  family)